METNSDLAVKIYSTSQISPTNGIFVLVTLNEYTVNTGRDRSKRPLNQETFEIITKSLSSLSCNQDVDFLKSGFICNNQYEVIYSIHGDGLDGLRKFLRLPKNQELLISILPVDK